LFSALHRTAEHGMEAPKAVRKVEKVSSAEGEKRRTLSQHRSEQESPDPQLAARVLDNVATYYLEKHLAVHRLPGAFDFFVDRPKDTAKAFLVKKEPRRVAGAK
jgi:hypothetical protein